MKKLIASAVSLLAGMVIGCYIGYRYYERHITNEAIEQMVQGIESCAKKKTITSNSEVTGAFTAAGAVWCL